jgi:hypothetical protein
LLLQASGALLRRRAANPMPASPVPNSAIVRGSGVVVIGPPAPAGFHGMFAGQLGGGVVGILVMMQLIVLQLTSGDSQFDNCDGSWASAFAADTTASEPALRRTRPSRFTINSRSRGSASSKIS